MDTEAREMRDWKYQQDSTLFRRGMNMASANEKFTDIVESLIDITSKRGKIEILAVGVASGEEPLSVLSVIDSLADIYKKKLEDMADLYIVDRRDPLKPGEIQQKAYKHIVKAMFPGNRLIFNALVDDEDPMQYHVKQNIVDFLSGKLKDPTHTHWKTPIQEHLRKDTKKYDFILYNNVDGHIWKEKDRNEVIRGLVMALKVGGVLVTDHMYGGSKRLTSLPDYEQIKLSLGLKETRPGIFTRTK